MKHVYFATVVLAVCIPLLTVPALGQNVSDPTMIRQQLAGKHLEITQSNGVYQFSYFLSVHFCSSGRYVSDIQKSRTTFMDHHEEQNVRDFGKWDVLSIAGQTYLTYVSFASGERSGIPVALLPDGRIWIQGFRVAVMGRAQCQ